MNTPSTPSRPHFAPDQALAWARAFLWPDSQRVAPAFAMLVRRWAGGLGRRVGAAGEGAPPPLTTEPEKAEPDELAQVREQMKQVERELRAAVEARQMAEAQRRQVMAAVAHDLRTPLSAIQALVDALADGVVSDPAAINKYHGMLRHEVCHLITVVEEMFELARIESGTLALARAPVSLEDLVAGAVDAQRARAARGRVRLWWEAEAARTDILGDAEQIYRVVEGAVRNALRHTPADGAVLVRLSLLGGEGQDGEARQALVRVVDTGHGIAAGALPHIFEPMYRAEAARTRQHHHPHLVVTDEDEDTDCEAGLGLAIAARLIAAHGGRMWAESPLPADARALVAGHPSAEADATKVEIWPGTMVCITLPSASAADARPLDVNDGGATE